MQRLALLLVVICGLANGQSLPKDKKDFYEDRERGWFWFEDPEKVEKPEPVNKPPTPQITPQPQQQRVPLDVKWLQDNLENIMINAINNPTEENLASYAYAQRLLLDKSSRFSRKMTNFMQTETLLDEENRRPTSAFALKEFKRERNEKVDGVIGEIQAKTQGLWFFYSSTCSYCMKMVPVIKRMQENHGIDVLAISLDGGVIPGMEAMEIVQDVNQEVASRFNVTMTPTTYLVMNDNTANLVAAGMKSLPDLEDRLLLTAMSNNVISKEAYERTRSVFEQNMFNNETGVLYADKQKLDNDPKYLANALRTQLEKTSTFGTRLVKQPK